MAAGPVAQRRLPGRIRSVKILAAGGTFAGATLAGLVLGSFVSGRTGQVLWVPGLLLAGLAVGGYAAVRMLLLEVRR